MSTLNVSNLSDGTDTVATGYVINGSAKAWVNFDGTGTVAIRDSYNISSLIDFDTGGYTINFTNAFGNANYASPSMTRNNFILGKFGTETASSLSMENRTNGGSETDSVYVTVAAIGDLA